MLFHYFQEIMLMNHFTDSAGNISRYPMTLEKAVEHKTTFYNDGINCKKCKSMAVKYTETGECRYCKMVDAGNLYNLSLKKNIVFTDENGKHFAKLPFGLEQEIEHDKFIEMVRLVELAAHDDRMVISPTPCKKRPHYGVKILNKCYECQQDKKGPSETALMMRDNPDMLLSKKDAKMYGLKVYRTGDECKKGHKAFRYVTTGNCIGCIKS